MSVFPQYKTDIVALKFIVIRILLFLKYKESCTDMFLPSPPPPRPGNKFRTIAWPSNLLCPSSFSRILQSFFLCSTLELKLIHMTNHLYPTITLPFNLKELMGIILCCFFDLETPLLPNPIPYPTLLMPPCSFSRESQE